MINYYWDTGSVNTGPVFSTLPDWRAEIWFNNIKVYLFSDLRPTPELSFALKYLNCKCGIVLTASHNPPEYNGYKVYWEDGGQIVPPEDKNIIEEINKLNYREINFKLNSDLIKYIDKEVDDAFIENSIQSGKLSDNNDIKIN